MRRTSYLLPLIVLSASFATAALPQKTEGFWAKVLKVLGITATPANQKGDEDPTVQGDIWVYKVDSKLASPVKQGNFSSPIFLPSGNVVLALSGEKVVKIDVVLEGTQISAGTAAELATIPGIIRLIAVQSDAADQVLILTDMDHDNCPGVAVLNLNDRSVVPLTHTNSKEDGNLIDYLRRSEREYDDGTKLEVRMEIKKKDGKDLQAVNAYLKLPGKDYANISRCPAGVNCGQPSVSNDRKYVLFVGKV